MTGNISLLHNVHDMLLIQVELANGMNTLATKKVLAYLNPKIILKDVLYVRKLNCRLISIGQFIEDLYSFFTFINEFCVT